MTPFHRFFPSRAPLALAALAVASTSLLHAQEARILAHHVPTLVSSGKAQPVGLLAPSEHLKLALSLPLRNESDLDALLSKLQDPKSPSYHKYLSTSEFTSKYGPTEADYATVVRWAESKGLKVTATTPNRAIVDVDGTSEAVSRAFNVDLRTYRDESLGRIFHAPDREPTAAGLSVSLAAVSGLDNAVPKHTHYKKGTDLLAGTSITQADNVISHIVGSGPGNTYLPSDMRAAYYGTGSLNGSGQTVAVFSYDGYLTSDVSLFYSSTSTTQTVPVSNVLVNGYNGACFGFTSSGEEDDNTCDDGEQILDIVNVAGMAPGLTKILFYEGDSSTDVLNQMATDNTAKVITSSWGGGDFGTASDTPFKEFQAQGQTYLNATGDSGAFNSSTYDPPSLDPYILQVGGTDLTTASAGGAWSAETGWTDSGGGYYASAGYAIPTWQSQTGVITSTNKGSTSYRNSPDVAAEANFDNTTVDDGSFESGYGGTSYATPRWAGYVALMNQQSVANGNSTVGFINTTLYTLGLGSSTKTDYHDITSGTNKASSGSGSFTAVAGYDLVTGWGSPNGPALINALAGSGTVAASYTLSASPSSLSVTAGSTGTSTITITAAGGFSSSVALTASGLPTGVTAAFSPASATSTSTLTFTVASSATAGASTITVTGTSGSLTKTTTISLTVSAAAAANYTLAASPTSLTVASGATGTSTITVTPTNGFTSSVALTASGLPTGVTAAFSPASTTSTSTLTFTVGSSAVAGTSTITVTGTSGSLSHTATISLTVTAATGTATQLIGDPGFENGTTVTPWTLSSGVICSNSTCSGETSHAGSWFIWLDGYGSKHTDTASQSIAIPSGKSTASLTFYLHIDTAETTTSTAYDTLKVQLLNSSGTVLTTLATYSNLNAASGYALKTFNVASYIGQTVTLKFTGAEDSSLQTSFVLDDINLTVQ